MTTAIEDPSPAWVTAVATAAGYLVVLAVLFVLLFVVPYLVFTTM